MTEKYIALFQNPEVWNDYKRTCLPVLKPARGKSRIPGRIFYGSTEEQTNPNTPAERRSRICSRYGTRTTRQAVSSNCAITPGRRDARSAGCVDSSVITMSRTRVPIPDGSLLGGATATIPRASPTPVGHDVKITLTDSGSGRARASDRSVGGGDSTAACRPTPAAISCSSVTGVRQRDGNEIDWKGERVAVPRPLVVESGRNADFRVRGRRCSARRSRSACRNPPGVQRRRLQLLRERSGRQQGGAK